MRKTTKTKALAALLLLAMTLSLTACGHEHTWADATCTAPKTCTACGKTEGEVLAHNWQDATCSAPKTCSLCKETEGETLPHTWEKATCAAPKTCSECGETEGEALPHTWREANHQSPQTCTVCGETEGDVLTPDFVTYNIPLAELGGTYDFVLPCYQNENQTTVAHVTVSDYNIFESNESFPAKEGYEYRQVTFTALFDDENAYKWGFKGHGYSIEDYYDIKFNDDSPTTEVENGESHLINNDGQEQEYTWFYPELDQSPWVDKKLTNTYIFTVCVPVGYDGIVTGICDNNTVSYDEGVYIYDIYQEGSFVLFRFA